MYVEKTVIISCAGKGSRLKFNIPKCLVQVNGKTIIERQLEQLKDIDDIIVVVGFKGDEVIEYVKSINSKVRFVYNNNYEHTATGASFTIGSKLANNDFIIALDGDLLVHPKDMERILQIDEEFVCGEIPHTDEPVYMQLNDKMETINFNRDSGDLEWAGLAGIKKQNITPNKWYVCNIMEELMPIKAVTIRAREIDTIHDYNEATRWIKNNYDDNKIIDEFFRKRFNLEDNYIVSRYSKNNRDEFDFNFILKYLSDNTTVLDLGCGTGVLEEKLAPYVKQIIGVDKYQEFIERAFRADNIEYIVSELSQLNISEKYDLVLLFGVSMYLSDNEFDKLIDKIILLMKKQSTLIVKNQWGVDEEVIINKFSEELQSIYYAKYRKLADICKYLSNKGFSVQVHDIYPPNLNKWSTTHEYALVLKRSDKNEN